MESSDLRSRANASKKGAEAVSQKGGKASAVKDENVSTHIGFFDILRVLGGIFLLSSTLSYFVTNESILWGYRPSFTQPAQVLAWFVSAKSQSHSYTSDSTYHSINNYNSVVLSSSTTLNYSATTAQILICQSTLP